MKQTFRAVGAGAVSAALVGVFVLPAAHASVDEAAPQAEIALAQALTTSLAEIAVPAQLPSAEEEALPEVAPVTAAIANRTDDGSSTETPAPAFVDVPAGAGASGIVAAALAQVGVMQDCTDLVQNSLAAAGYTTRRDQGGYDRGPNLGDWLPFGTQVSLDSLAPGDIIVYGGSPHVAIYIGGGQAVHGGVYGFGGTAVMSVGAAFGFAQFAVRPA